MSDYPARAYSTNPAHIFQSSSYDPLPSDQDFSVPRRPVPSTRNESEIQLIHPGHRGPVAVETRVGAFMVAMVVSGDLRHGTRCRLVVVRCHSITSL